MAQIPTTNISLQAIQVETNHSGTSNISLKSQSENVGNTTHTSTIPGYTSPGGGLTGTPYGMGEFGGFRNTFATTSINSITAASVSVTQAVTAGFTFSVKYVGSLIRVQVIANGNQTASPNTLSTAFTITGAPAGYTVKHGTFTPAEVGGNDDDFTQTGNITSSPISILSNFSRQLQLTLNSEGGFDDPSERINFGTGSLIFEKSGDTTYTYSFSYEVEAQCLGEGGE